MHGSVYSFAKILGSCAPRFQCQFYVVAFEHYSKNGDKPQLFEGKVYGHTINTTPSGG
ncbi:hypothetical protein SAMN02745866_01573 [Alteromonadaceae bacterium Bs31]|nr:hypothetical protein SAMN02745866_01573 [Alteromonadaceae bacterium Bs31]